MSNISTVIDQVIRIDDDDEDEKNEGEKSDVAATENQNDEKKDKKEPLSLEELLAKRKAEEEAKTKVSGCPSL